MNSKKGSEKARNVLGRMTLFDFDHIFWPLLINDCHWILCLLDCNRRNFSFLDPYHPTEMVSHDVSSTMLNSLTILSEKDDRVYNLHKPWTLISSTNLCQLFTFPSQPSSNSYDCGVIVCIYIWCLVIGSAFPFLSSSHELSNDVAHSLRTQILLLILKSKRCQQTQS